ncbi:MAG: zinc ribbon domain-containing protein [Sedimentisphaerales bacterium]|nr:zinc ribbon domain-containing protein [Sedimentisphaerales bacterium]
MTERPLDPGHAKTRNTLRTVGPILIVLGLVLIVLGIAGIFLVSPVCIVLAFVGMPVLFVGSSMSMFGFVGRMARYQAQEVAPVAKDTFNYMAKGTSDGVRTMASALGQGLREGGFGGSSQMMVRCHQCNALVPDGATFCSQCGQTLGKTKPCPGCQELNELDAKFCDNCGHRFA